MPRGPIIYGDPVEWGHPLNRGLLSWWMPIRGRGAGQTLFDIAGRNHGTLTNGPTWGPGRSEEFGAVTTDGTDDYVQVSSFSSYSFPTTFTAEMVISVPSVPATDRNWLASDSGGGGASGYWRIRSGGGAVRFAAGAGYNFTGSTVLAVGVRYHVCVTRDAANAMAIYVNGRLDATGSFSGTLGPNQLQIGTFTGAAEYIASTFFSVSIGSTVRTAADAFAAYDQALRGYPDMIRRLPTSRSYVGSGGGGAFNAAWAAGSNVIVGSAF